MRCIRMLVFAAWVGIAGLALGQAPAPQQLVEAMHLQDYTLQYQDEQGRAISADEFMQALAGGKAIRVSKDTDKKIATLMIGASATAGIPSKVAFETGDPVPAITGTDLDGRPVTVRPGGGKYTILSFYFSECAPCIDEVPDLNAFARAHDDVRMVAVTFDSAAETARFVQQYHLQLQTVSDAQDFVTKAGVRAYPTLMLVDPMGRFVAAKTGGIFDSGDKSSGSGNLEKWFALHARSAGSTD